MKLKEAIQLLKEHNLWRRYDGKIGEGPKMAQPRDLGIAIDTVVKHFESKKTDNNCLACGNKTEDKADHCEVCECKGNEAYKE